LMALITEFMGLQTGYVRMVRVEELAHAAAREAEIAGAFSDELARGLASDIALVYGVSAGEVTVRTEDYGGAAPGFQYRVTIPVKRIIASNRMFGISDAENSGYKVIEGRGVYIPRYEDIFPKPEVPDEPETPGEPETPDEPETS